MIKLSGLIPGKDIEIKVTGLRPGEKLKEELLNDAENTLPTHHPKIMVGKVREYPFDTIAKQILELKSAIASYDEMKIVGTVKSIVPEYISNNSRFEILDKQRFQQKID
jgi:FlaA1/EpsC-like NDP-sugar epimerase